jgi:hypothetical protein
LKKKKETFKDELFLRLSVYGSVCWFFPKQENVSQNGNLLKFTTHIYDGCFLTQLGNVDSR